MPPVFPAEPVLLVSATVCVQEEALASLVPVPKALAALWLPVRERVPELALVVLSPRPRVASASHLASL